PVLNKACCNQSGIAPVRGIGRNSITFTTYTAMKNIFSFLISGFLLTHLSAQTSLSPADWQADLRFLQHTVHEDYSFLFKKISAPAWDANVEELYAAIPAMQPHEILAGLGRIVSSFQYGHTDIGWRQSPVKYH